jgi:signal transduction histidine kinase
MKQAEDLDNLAGEPSRHGANPMQQLQQRDMLAALGLNASKVVHEIANPLNAMFSSVQMLEREIAAGGVSRQRVEVTTGYLRGEIRRLQSLLYEMRDIARPLKLSFTRVSCAAAVGKALHELSPAAVAAAVQVREDFSEALPPVIADPEKLKQVVLNLAKNAIEAMPQGGRLTIRGYRSGENVCLEIQDTGPGIPCGVQVFHPFATSKPDGWGLGLCIARQIITAHDGTIDYASEVGRGTTFKISLPAAAPDRRSYALMLREGLEQAGFRSCGRAERSEGIRRA